MSDQGHGDLGERMAQAAERALDAGHAVLLMERIADLSTDGFDWRRRLLTSDTALVPAFDGGYVLLVLNPCFPACFGISPATSAWRGVPWSRMDLWTGA
jgi:glycosyltransferase A (GT-A) superfamily protein (DUF2064 family)